MAVEEIENNQEEKEITSTVKTTEPTPENNIIFVGEKWKNGKLVEIEAPTTYSTPGSIFENLPESDIQKKGFYYERAAELCRAFPGYYKPIVKKGE